MKIRLYIALIFIAISCNKNKNTCSSDKKALIYIYNKDDYFKRTKLISGQSFTFHKVYIDSCNKVESLKIFFPDSVTSFSRELKETCIVVKTHQNCNTKSITDTIESGVIKGKLIDNDLWELQINIPNFNFEGIVSSKVTNDGFRWE